MRTVLTLFLILACTQALFAETMLVMVDGYCYLEGQSEYSETKVKFIKDSPSAVTDSTYTDSSGDFFISDLYEGIYDIEYTHADFDTQRVEDKVLVGSTTLPPVTLAWPFCNVDGFCYLENQTIHWGTKVKFAAVSAPAVSDSTYTDSCGYFMMDGLHDGVYNIEYTHLGFDSMLVEDQSLVDNTTLPPVTLEQPPCELSGSLQGTLGPDTCHIVGEISITAGDSLILLPGTVFMFDGPYPFRIYGTLLAEGTENDSIVFTTEQSGSNRWRGLRFDGGGSSGSRLAYCLIEKGYATGGWPDNNGGGVFCFDYSSPSFANCCTSANNAENGGGLYCRYSTPAFSNCTVSNNWVSNEGGGVVCNYSSPAFTNCILTGNSADANSGGVHCYDSSPSFMNSLINGNSAYAGGAWAATGIPQRPSSTVPSARTR